MRPTHEERTAQYDLVVHGYQLAENDQVFLGNANGGTGQISRFGTRLGLTGTDIARRMRLDASIVTLWSTNTRPVPHSRVAGLAEALEVRVDVLLDGAEVVVGGYKHKQVPVSSAQRQLRQKRDKTGQLFRWTDQTAETEWVPPLPVPITPSVYRLDWCYRGGRLHHHGPLPTWKPGPPMSLADLW